MVDILHLLVGDDFVAPVGEGGLGDEQDFQDSMEYLVAELHVDPRATSEDESGTNHQWYVLADILEAILLRVEALEE